MFFIKEKLEKMGIYIFFVSLALFTQINWARRNDSYDDLEFRFFLAMVLSIGLSLLVLEVLRRVISKNDSCNVEDILAKISFSLAPGFLFLFASKNIAFLYLGVGFCFFMILNSFLRPSERFINILEINGDMAKIKVEGAYVEKNGSALKGFLSDFILNLNECIETNVTNIKVDFSRLEKSDGAELKAMMDEITKYFDLELSYC